MGSPAGIYGYQYDGIGRISNVSFPWPGGSIAHTYRANGWLQQTDGVRTYTSYAYNNRGLLKTLTNYSKQVNFNGVILSAFTAMTYDAAGNRLGLSASIPAVGSAPAASRTQTFSYDTAYPGMPNLARDVLLKENSSGATNVYNLNYAHAFGYDSAYNPNTVRGAAVPYNRDNQRSDSGFSHDGNGNPTAYGGATFPTGATFAFDGEDRLTAITSPNASQNLSAAYGADGLRASRTTGALGTLWFLYDEAGASQTPLIELTYNSGANTTTVGAANGFAADGWRMRYYPAGSNGSSASTTST